MDGMEKHNTEHLAEQELRLGRMREPVFLQGHALYTCATCGALVRAHKILDHDRWHRGRGE